MVNIAILGCGVVGSGVLQVLNQNQAHIQRKAGQSIAVAHVLDRREIPGVAVTQDFEAILADASVQIVVEVMGGLQPAYDYVKRALLAGKHVVTSNKELVIAHGAELLAIARERQLNFMFEASVGGGIPVVRPINVALTTDRIVAIGGILNGTSNYMITRMGGVGASYAAAFAEACEKGYAEAGSTADTGGFDACRKLAILLSLATGKQVDYQDITTEGIESIDAADFAFARAFGLHIKPMVSGRILPDGVAAVSAPFLVHPSNVLSAVSGVNNGVVVQAAATGDIMFYGPGAGQLPTAGAVVSDIVDVANHLHRHIMHDWHAEKMPVLPQAQYVSAKMVRVAYNTADHACIPALEAFLCRYLNLPSGPVAVTAKEHPGFAAFITPQQNHAATQTLLARLREMPGITGVERVLRVYD